MRVPRTDRRLFGRVRRSRWVAKGGVLSAAKLATPEGAENASQQVRVCAAGTLAGREFACGHVCFLNRIGVWTHLCPCWDDTDDSDPKGCM